MVNNEQARLETNYRSSHRAAAWRLRTRTLQLPPRPLLMGIVNVTPDSFSDGGRFLESKAAIEHALKLVAEGADLLDIGGESTRPGSRPIAVQEEIDRVISVLEAVCRQTTAPVSIDTSKATVARAAIAAGAEIINDVTAFTDSAMLEMAIQSGAGLCAMHMQGTPQTMQDDPRYDDVVGEVFAFLRRARDRLLAAGISQSRICLDPGIGFGKTREHNLALVASAWRFHELGCPVLIGHSRKSFLSRAAVQEDGEQTDQNAATCTMSCDLMSQGVQILRVHDVAANRRALEIFEATG
ncbi:MAG TPA: dihydropteroate synthase [Pirellulales bacterium]